MKSTLSFKVIVLQRIFYFLLWLMRWSYRIHYVGSEYRRQAEEQHSRQSFLLASWHEHLIGVLCSHQRFHTIVSSSEFGQVVAFVCRKFGYQVHFGSADRGQNKGGLRALLGLGRALRTGARAIITVDGSIGPRRVAKKGILELSHQTGAEIVPVAVVASRYWEFSTWDRLKLPKPFARVVVAYGPALRVAKRDPEAYTGLISDLGNAINAAEQSAQKYLHVQTR